MKPYHEESQGIYDVSDEFFALFLDPTMGYTCAYFERRHDPRRRRTPVRPGAGQAQPRARNDAARRGRLGQRCCAVEKFDVNVIGITLSKNQSAYSRSCSAASDQPGPSRSACRGWEEFDDKVDRIVSIGAFEAFKVERYPAFFAAAHSVLPDDGRMLLHTILAQYGLLPRQRHQDHHQRSGSS
jgi:cyclopropane-fatty-acyl-phospholipid synthase